MTIDYNISTPINKAPKALPKDGSRQKVIDYWHRELAEGRNRPYQEVTYSATVLYTAFLSTVNFINKYDLSFVNYVMGGDIVTALDAIGSPTKRVLETIVFIPEICGCLPRPPAGQDRKFYQFLQEQTIKNKQQGFAQAAANSKKSKKFPTRYIENMKMFPRAYTLIDKIDKKTPKLSINSRVRVRFPYDFDIYAGVLVDSIGK